MKTNAIKITVWGRTVGYASWDKAAHRALFQYDREYVESGRELSPLQMPLTSERSRRGMVWYGDTDKLYQGLPPMLADSLPDHWGNSIFNAWLRDNHIRSSEVTPLDLLSFIGRRAMGALEFEPAQELGGEGAFDVDVQKLYDFAREVLAAREAVTLTAERSVLWQDLIRLGTSPGGRRPKAVIAFNPTTGEAKSGQSDVPEGFVHYILKYDGGGAFPFARMEYVYYRMATAAGIEMMPSELRDFGGVTHFLTRRFDREGNRKVHTQTLAAMAPGAASYDDLFEVIRRLRLPYKASEQQFLRMVFNVLGCNVDDHSKNFSFCMDRSGAWSLSPAYDVTFAIEASAPAYVNRHSLLVGGKDSGITLSDMLDVARRNDIDHPKELIERVREALAAFPAEARSAGVPDDVAGLVGRFLSDAERDAR